jgi:hypothetical protein
MYSVYDRLNDHVSALREAEELAEPTLPLSELIKELSDEVEQMAYAAGGVDIPTDAFLKGVEILRLIPLLYAKIKHGEPGHEAWLKEAIECHFLGKPMPEYVAK